MISSTLAAAVRLTWLPLPASRSMHRPTWQEILHRAVPTAALLLLAISLSLPESSISGLCALWAMILLEELWAWLPQQTLFRRRYPSHGRDPAVERTTDVAQGSARNAVAHGVEVDASVTQQIVRTMSADGEELIRGQLRIAFVPGQRTTAAHLAFCPSFEQTPHMEFRQVSGPAARVKLAQIYPYGARFDLKLAAVATESMSVVLDFSVAGKSLAIV
jgi:hypothetical protein